MKVLFNTYSSAFVTPGGGERQIIDYINQLPGYGISPLPFDIWNPQIEDADIVHYFSVVGGSISFCDFIKKRNIPLVISPNFWLSEGDEKKYPLEDIYAQLSLADLILLNSESEAASYKKVFGFDGNKIKVIKPFIPDLFFNAADEFAVEKVLKISQPYIVCVANIEPRKNQLMLIEAVKKFPNYKLLLVGNIRDEGYADLCMKNASSQVSYIGFIPRSASLLRSILSKASLFVLPSDVESPSYAAIEAASQGCNVLITKFGSMQEFLGGDANYIDPSSVQGIENGILESLNKNIDKVDLIASIKNKFSAKNSCNALAEVYRSLLNPI